MRSKTILNDIIDLNEKLNLYKYGIPDNGNLIENPSDEDFYLKYKLLAPREFEKYKMGVCWDYVTYIAYYFKKNFPSIFFKTFFHMIDDNENCPSHTFFLFYLNNRTYWFESSWKPERGVFEFNHESDAIDYIIGKLKIDYENFPSYLVEYNALDRSLIHKSCTEFMDYMINKINKNRVVQTKSGKRYKSNPIPNRLAVESLKEESGFLGKIAEESYKEGYQAALDDLGI